MGIITVGLDIDGILHPRSAGGRYFREENITPLLDVLKGHDIEIVITSTWRLDVPVDELIQNMGGLGEYVVGVTPEVDDPFQKAVRQAELEQWIHDNGRNLDNWIAIDDVQAFYEKDAPLLIVDGSVGFTEKNSQALHALLTTRVLPR